MIERLNHTTVFVLDQEEALRFYRDKLGFEVRTDATMDNGFRWLTVSPKTQPDLEIVLMKIKEGPMYSAERAATLKGLIKEGAFCIGVFETFVSARFGDAWASAALYIAVLAVLWAWVAKRGGGLLAPYAAHMTLDWLVDPVL